MTARFVWLAAMVAVVTQGFSPRPIHVQRSSLLKAGGFEWEDPQEAFDQGVENPFKNPDLMKDLKKDSRLIQPDCSVLVCKVLISTLLV